LDLNSCLEIERRYSPLWFVPRGLGPWMQNNVKARAERIVELSWWEEHTLNDKTKVSMTPARHWCRRSLLDRNKVLWGGYVFTVNGKKFFFAGDTAYCPVFKQIGEIYGPIDLAAIPIGAYCPRFFMHHSHVDPHEAVLMHQDLKAARSVGIHYGTFLLSDEPLVEPREGLRTAAEEAGLEKDDFIAAVHGRTVVC